MLLVGLAPAWQNNMEEVPTFTTQMSGKPASGLRKSLISLFLQEKTKMKGIGRCVVWVGM